MRRAAYYCRRMYKICIEQPSDVRLTRGYTSTGCVRCEKSSAKRPGEKLWTENRTCVCLCSREARKGEQERDARRKGGRRSGGELRLEAPLIHEYIHRLRRNFDHAVNRIPRRVAMLPSILRKDFSQCRLMRYSAACFYAFYEKGP